MVGNGRQWSYNDRQYIRTWYTMVDNLLEHVIQCYVMVGNGRQIY